MQQFRVTGSDCTSAKLRRESVQKVGADDQDLGPNQFY